MNYHKCLRGDVMKYYLLVLSNIFMLNVARVLLFFKCEKLVKVIINQCDKNNELIERGV